MSRATFSEQILAHLVSAVRGAAVDAEPFDHVRLCGVFPDALYSRIIANLPETKFYGEVKHSDARLPNGRSARRKLELRPAHLRRLPPPQRELWLAIADALTASGLQAAFNERFAAALEKRFGRPAATLKFHPAPILLRDLGGYKISVHTDSFRKAITTQYYLPSHRGQLHLGTAFHTKHDGAFAKVRTLEFAPNTGYAFPVSESSWHSVEQMRHDDGERNSLMLTYYVRQGLPGEMINAGKRLAQDVLAWCAPKSGGSAAP